MGETVVAPTRGLELYPGRGAARALKVPPKRLEPLEKLGIATVQDLLQHYPRYHVDRTQVRTIAEWSEMIPPGGEIEVQILAKARPPQLVAMKPRPGKKAQKMIRGGIDDGTGKVEVTWFNQTWVVRSLGGAPEAFFYGKLRRFGPRNRLQMTAPRFELVRSGKEPFNVGRIIPIYPATADLPSDALRKLMWEELQKVGDIADPIPREIVQRSGLMGRGDALRLIHFPDTKEEVMQARRRLVFDEVFTLQLGMVFRKRKLERTVQGIRHDRPSADSLPEAFVSELPFSLTGSQRKACEEVVEDMARACPMHRMLEGEVGSGKTVVALFACLNAIAGGHQSAFMAPTEVLAEQHHLTIGELLDRAFGPDEAKNLFAHVSRRPTVRLLTGSTPAAERAAIARDVALGEVDLLIGTHALIQDSVEFDSLGVAVVDEQHRFGVDQRRSLRAKGRSGEPDILVMSATPIPRTLAVSLYGDLDLSVLDELPKGRQPIETRLLHGQEGRARAYDLIRREVVAGRQAFIVYALRDESDKVEVKSAKAEAKRLAQDVFPDLSVGLVHGDMKSTEKEAAMTAVRSGATDVLVATTVIEVGVDVPNATVMMVEDAERFGLAQLHQLRGRVGRGVHRSYCALVTEIETGVEDAGANAALERLRAVESTRDGFKLAEVDLEQRGEGTLFGARQSGMPELKLTRILRHQKEVKEARDLAIGILDEDPGLRRWEHQDLAREMRARFPEGALDVLHSG